MGKMTFTAAGDAILTRRLPGAGGDGRIREYLMRGEARAVNLEVVLTHFGSFASSYCGGTWLGTRPDALSDLLSYGFNLMGLANNHTMDYSYGGLAETLEAVERSGVVHAGAGRDLPEAARPGILDVPSGRVAIISVCSTFNDTARAGEPSPPLPGRPGLNPLRFSTRYTVTPAQMQSLREIVADTRMNGRVSNSMAQGYTPKNPPGTLYMDGVLFEEGQTPAKHTRVHPGDMDRTEAGIREALGSADHVLVMAHSHEIPALCEHEPDEFFVEFCRRCIDAGASAVLGTGTHQLKPIEVYKGRPIFYSLGNFIFQPGTAERLPLDYNERYGFPPGLSVAECFRRRSDGGRLGLEAMEVNFHSVLPYFEIEDGRLTRLSLKPVELGFKTEPEMKGWPVPEPPEWMHSYLNEICKPFGTRFAIRDGLLELCL